MNWSATLRMLALVLLLGALLWWAERGKETETPRWNSKDKAFRLDPQAVTEMVIEKQDLRLTLTRKDGIWYLAQPVQGRADSGEVDKILSILETAPRRETITGQERQQRDLTIADYGFSPPRGRFLLRTPGGETEILVGGDAPIGEEIYVKTGADDDVVRVSKDLLGAIPDNVDRLRDRVILRGDAERTVRLEIQRPSGGLIQLVKTGTRWMIQQPIVLRADTARVARILDDLYGLRAERFVWDPPSTPAAASPPSAPEMESGARMELYGLAPDVAMLRLRVWEVGDQTGKGVLIGKAVDETGTLHFAKQRDLESVFAVSAAAISGFSVTVNDLRDRNLLPMNGSDIRYLLFHEGDRRLTAQRDERGSWFVTEPVQWKADDEFVNELADRLGKLRVDAVVEPAETNLAGFGLSPPAFSVLALAAIPAVHTNETVAASAPARPAVSTSVAESAPPRLHVGRPIEGSANSYVLFEGMSTPLAVTEAELRPLRVAVTDPLLYCDRTMLAIEPITVWRITLFKNGREQVVSRSENGDWLAQGNPSNQVSRAAIDSLLGVVSNLRALRTEINNPKYLASYGLDETGARITFALTGAEGIQKTLLLGFRARTDGVYATVQGQDVVFVVANSIAERLLRDLAPNP